jgi:hypothetical protein
MLLFYLLLQQNGYSQKLINEQTSACIEKWMALSTLFFALLSGVGTVGLWIYEMMKGTHN